MHKLTLNESPGKRSRAQAQVQFNSTSPHTYRYSKIMIRNGVTDFSIDAIMADRSNSTNSDTSSSSSGSNHQSCSDNLKTIYNQQQQQQVDGLAAAAAVVAGLMPQNNNNNLSANMALDLSRMLSSFAAATCANQAQLAVPFHHNFHHQIHGQPDDEVDVVGVERDYEDAMRLLSITNQPIPQFQITTPLSSKMIESSLVSSQQQLYQHHSPASSTASTPANGISPPTNQSNSNRAASVGAKKPRPKKYQCPYCWVALSNTGQFRGHIRIHTGERPFKCDFQFCCKTFTRNEELTRHKRIHTGQRPYACQLCNKCFGRKDHLKKHTRTHERSAQRLTTANENCNKPQGNGGFNGDDNIQPADATAPTEFTKPTDFRMDPFQ